MLEYHGHSLLMDTGAAKNLAGAYTLKSYEREYLLPYGTHIGTEPSTASFTGISGASQGAKVMTDSPVYPGGALGEMRYKAHALDNSNLPMLLCCGSMRASGFIINMNNDAIRDYIRELLHCYIMMLKKRQSSNQWRNKC